MPQTIPTSSHDRSRLYRRAPAPLPAVVGAALVLVGVGLLGEVIFALYGGSAQADQLAFRLGLGGACLLSGLSQIALLVGGWMIWRSFRPRPA